MDAEIIDQYLSQIRQDLIGRGLTYERLQDDLLDHICCMVEEGMEHGNDFQHAYRDVMSGIGEATLSDIQHQTLLLLDKKFQQMKKTTYTMGLIGSSLTIIGAALKTMHMPGAAIVLLIGFLLVACWFLPFYFILSYREQAEKPQLIFPVVGYVSLLFILTGALFKILHWPGAGMIITVSIFIILVGFLPLYLVQIFGRTSMKKFNPAYLVMFLVGLSIVVLLTRINLSKEAINQYTKMSLENLESARLLKQGTTAFFPRNADSMITDEVHKVSGYADRLDAMAGQMLEHMLLTVNEPGVPIDKVTRRNYRYGGREVFKENDFAEEYKALAREYRDYLLQIIRDPILAGEIRQVLRFSSEDEIIGWTPNSYFYDPLIINYYMVTGFKRAILETEYLTLGYLTEKH